jgi:hypothetical protein
MSDRPRAWTNIADVQARECRSSQGGPHVSQKSSEPQVWRLKYRGEDVAALEVVDSDFPWLMATVHPLPRFSEVRAIFDTAASRALDGTEGGWDDETVESWEQILERIRADFDLVRPDGVTVAEFLLHIDGDAASWRWSDTPFDADPG